jgi:hypothetical protein
MVTMPELDQTMLWHFVTALGLMHLLSNEEIEGVAHALERAAGVHDLQDLEACKKIAEVVRGYKEAL